MVPGSLYSQFVISLVFTILNELCSLGSKNGRLLFVLGIIFTLKATVAGLGVV
jgi:hypothetical protein